MANQQDSQMQVESLQVHTVETVQQTPFDPKWFNNFLADGGANFNMNNARILYDAMSEGHKKETEELRKEIAKLETDHTQFMKYSLESASERDQEIADQKRENTKLSNELKAEKEKFKKLEETNRKLTKELTAAKASGVIKKDFQDSFQALKKSKIALEKKLESLEHEENGNEYMRIEFGMQLHKLLDGIYNILGLSLSNHVLETNEVEREKKVYVHLQKKLKCVLKHLKKTLKKN